MKAVIAMFVSLLLGGAACSNSSGEGASLLTDMEMVEYLKANQAGFDSLRTWIVQDELEFMLLDSSDDRYLSKISQERADAYFDLMRRLNIVNMARGNKYKHNSIVFYFPVEKGRVREINKGYEYKVDSTQKNADWVEAKGDLIEEAKKQNLNRFVYKPIDEHWAIMCIIQ